MPIRSTATATSTSEELKNTFSNDGSFIEKFKKMQESKDTSSEIQKNTPERSEYSTFNQSKSNTGHSSYSTSYNTKSHKDILSTPPPPPPNFINVEKNEKEGNLAHIRLKIHLLLAIFFRTAIYVMSFSIYNITANKIRG